MIATKRTFRPKNEEGDEEYGVVTKVLGGNHVDVLCYDKVVRQCVIPGKLQHTSVWFELGYVQGNFGFRALHLINFYYRSFVLVKLRSYQDAKGELMMKYSSQEVICLQEKYNVNTNIEPLGFSTQQQEQQQEIVVEAIDGSFATAAPGSST